MATQQQTDVDEEGVRLIRVFRPAKDAESLFKIDIVSELALYIHMLQSGGDYSGMFDTDDADGENSFATSMANKLATGRGVNFAHATTVVMEATRIYSKKVDYLRQQMDLALVNLSSGNLTKATKMGKQKARALKSNVKGISALSDWTLTNVNEATELLHLPWAKWAGREGVGSGNLILNDEHDVHSEMSQFLRPQSDESLEDFAKRLTTTDFPAFKPKPRTLHVRHRAEKKRQCILRPLLELMPRQETALAPDRRKSTEIDTEVLRAHLATSKLMSSKMHLSGLLYTPVSQHLLPRDALHSRKDWSVAATPHMGSILYGLPSQSKSPNLPDTSRLFCPSTRHSIPTQGVENQDPGTVQNKSTLRATPSPHTIAQASVQGEDRTRRLRPIVKSKDRCVSLLDEHTICGKDVAARQAKTFTRPNLDLYNLEVDKITSVEVARLLLKGRRGIQEYLQETNKDKRRIHQTINEWKVEQGFIRSAKKMSDESVPVSLPYFDDVKKPPSRLDLISLRFNFTALQSLLTETRRRVVFKVSSEMAETETETELERANEPDEVWEDLAEFDASIFKSHAPMSDSTMQAVSSPNEQTSEGNIFNDAMYKARDVIYHMHQRVGLWRERVEQWIITSSSLGTFNVAEYIEKIATSLKGQAKGVDGNTSLSFGDIVKDCPRHEVCRTFLTTLLLANKHGFRLEQDLKAVGQSDNIPLVIHFGAVQPDQLTADHFDGVPEKVDEAEEEEKSSASVTSRKRSRCVDSEEPESSEMSD